MTRRRLLALAALLLLALAAFGLWPRPLSYTPAVPAVGPVDAWVAAKIAESQRLGVRPGNEERLARVSPERTPTAILYLHGFGASRAEGEAVVEPVAAKLGANTLYGRLPGHGLDDMDAHAAAGLDDYLDNVEETFQAAMQLGEQVLLIGSSTGGLLATWLAARHPEQVAGLILAAPFYGFGDPAAALLIDRPIGPPLIRAAFGEVRNAGWTTDPEQRKQEGYERYWTIEQRYDALFQLASLRRFTATDETFDAVRAPALLFYYYKDEAHQDTIVSLDVMKAAFARFGGSEGPHPASRMVPISDGNHILFSRYVRTDKATIGKDIDVFLASAGLLP